MDPDFGIQHIIQAYFHRQRSCKLCLRCSKFLFLSLMFCSKCKCGLYRLIERKIISKVFLWMIYSELFTYCIKLQEYHFELCSYWTIEFVGTHVFLLSSFLRSSPFSPRLIDWIQTEFRDYWKICVDGFKKW